MGKEPVPFKIIFACILLLRLSKGNAPVVIPLFFRSVANRIQVLIIRAQPFDSDACATLRLMRMWHGAMADEGSFRGAKPA